MSPPLTPSVITPRIEEASCGAEPLLAIRTGIPAYRLPRHILDHEIDHILRFGVEARTGTQVDRARLLELSQQYAAVFIATGLQERHTLRLADNGDALAGVVIEGLDFLDRVRQEWDVEIAAVPSTVVSKTSLPAKPKVLVLPGH